jgi:hypothetical protein
MKIQLSDIEPILAQRIRDEEQQIAEAIQTGRQLPGWTPFHEAIKYREKGKAGPFKVTAVGIVLSIIGAVLFLRMGAIVGIPAVFLLLVTVLAVVLFSLSHRYQYRLRKQNTEAQLASLGLPVIARSKEEKLYSDLVEELSQASGATEDAARSLLREMNALMGSYRMLEQRYEDGKKAMGNRSVEGLEAELRGLQKRAEAATDPVTREALEQSVQLCRSRIESAKALTLAQERAKAHQEVVLQTLGSVHTAFAHMRNAPNDVYFEAEQLLETVNDLQSRTRAVEQAVEELMVVRTR